MSFKNAFYRFLELLQILLFFYTVAAVFYTTIYFVIDPLQRRVSSAVSWIFLDGTEEMIAVKPRFKNWTLFLESPDKTSLSWKTSSAISDRTAHAYSVGEDLFLSKAFSSSLHPIRVTSTERTLQSRRSSRAIGSKSLRALSRDTEVWNVLRLHHCCHIVFCRSHLSDYTRQQ